MEEFQLSPMQLGVLREVIEDKQSTFNSGASLDDPSYIELVENFQAKAATVIGLANAGFFSIKTVKKEPHPKNPRIKLIKLVWIEELDDDQRSAIMEYLN
jgi:hypothetical protein